MYKAYILCGFAFWKDNLPNLKGNLQDYRSCDHERSQKIDFIFKFTYNWFNDVTAIQIRCITNFSYSVFLLSLGVVHV